MTEPVQQRYHRLAAAFADTVAAVPADRFESPSPCEEWTARDVVRHVVDAQGMFLGFVSRSLPDDLPSVDDDPVAAFEAARRTVQAGLEDPDVADAEYEGAFGTSTFAKAVDTYLCFDLNVHRWDLATAAGLDARIDPGEVPRLRRDTDGFGDMMRSSGAFGPEVEAPHGADEQARFLAYLGRRPA